MMIGEALAWAKQQLPQPSDADYLLCDCLEQSRSYLYTWPDKRLSDEQINRYKAMLTRRLNGEPVAYITGKKAFWKFVLHTSKDTLIPREETEILVETALDIIARDKIQSICDLGTGSGAVALALAHEYKDIAVTGVDVIDGAIALAKKNAAELNIANVTFLSSNWFAALPDKRFDMIVSNPPYVETNSPYLAHGDVKFEPNTALTSGGDGLDDIRHIIQRAQDFLSANGWLLFEHGYAQHAQIAKLMQQAGYVDIQCAQDLNQHQRVTFGKRAD